MHRRPGPAEDLLERGPALPERLPAQVGVVQREQVERDEVSRGLLGQHRDPAGRRVDPLQQRLEVEPAAAASGITISPSITQRCGNWASTASTSSGK